MNKKELEQLLAVALAAGVMSEKGNADSGSASLSQIADEIEADISPDGKDILFIWGKDVAPEEMAYKLVKKGKKFKCVEHPYAGE